MVSLCVVGQRGDVRNRQTVKEQESHQNQNGTYVYVPLLCNIYSYNFLSDDDRITSSDTTSHSQSALSKCVAHAYDWTLMYTIYH